MAKTTSKRSAKVAKPALLSGGNPQIAKADGDAPVRAYIAAMPGWKRNVRRRLDALIVRTVPDVRKAVKWNSPFSSADVAAKRVLSLAGNDREPRLRELGVLPAGLLDAAAEQREKLRNVCLRDRVVVGEDQHHRHGQCFHIGGPVVGRAHHPADLVEELREALRL